MPSNTCDLRAEIAVLSLLRLHGASARAGIPIERVAQAWPGYGLRAGDLAPAVARLVRRDRLRLDALDHLQPTAAGTHWLAQVPSALEYRLLLQRRRQILGQQAASGGEALTRRRGDAALAPASAGIPGL